MELNSVCRSRYRNGEEKRQPDRAQEDWRSEGVRGAEKTTTTTTTKTTARTTFLSVQVGMGEVVRVCAREVRGKECGIEIEGDKEEVGRKEQRRVAD